MRVSLLLAVVLLAACGSTAAKQAEDLQSLAAEGALMAHDAGEGDDWAPYTRAHAEELAKKASSLESKAKTEALSALARDVARELAQLEHADPDDARALERRLEDAAKRAEELA
jgi:hypothetical protein